MEYKDLEKILNKWFEMKLKTYDKLEHDGSIYLYYEGQEHAEIRIDKKSKFIYYKWGLYKEFSEIIPNKYLEFEEFMGKWFEDIFGLKGFTPERLHFLSITELKIPLI